MEEGVIVTIGVVIPTKNRVGDLFRAIESVKRQTYLSNEIIVVDQSDTDDAKEGIEGLLRDYSLIKQKYVFNRNLSGLTAAKNAGLEQAESDVLLFIDDDIVLDEKFLDVLRCTYEKYPELGGVGGLAEVSYEKVSRFRRKAALLFQTGPFRDFRAVIQAGYMRDRDIVPTWWLSGGLSSVRREVFDKVRFNEGLKGASPIEDFDFYFRASKYFKFAIAPGAKALHNISQTSRHNTCRAFEMKCSGFCYIFEKYVDKTLKNKLAILWRNIGFFIDALIKSASYKTLAPLKGAFSAWYKAIVKKEYTI
ncbi:MAG: glycosyltransferase family A protein [Candidatus Omnitrophota bacterium]